VPAKSDSKHPKIRALVEEGTLNPESGKVQDPKFLAGEFFDARDIVQVKYETLRRVSVENASVTSAREEYGVSRPTYYQTRASFEEAGIAGLVPREARSAGSAQGAGRCAGIYPAATGRGRAHSSAPAGQADQEEIRSRYSSAESALRQMGTSDAYTQSHSRRPDPRKTQIDQRTWQMNRKSVCEVPRSNGSDHGSEDCSSLSSAAMGLSHRRRMIQWGRIGLSVLAPPTAERRNAYARMRLKGGSLGFG
jgi:hypothetical protein